jgi:hypothetical protein
VRRFERSVRSGKHGELGGENLDQQTPLPVEKDSFTSCTGMTCLSLLLRMRTEWRCLLLAGEVAVE